MSTKVCCFCAQTGLCIECLRDPKAIGELNRQSGGKVLHVTPSEPFLMVTTPSIPGRDIAKSLGIVTAQVTFGMDLFKDIDTSFRDVFGGRAKSVQNILAESRNAAFEELQQEARHLGADAVVGVDLDFTEFSAGMVLVMVTGTAVRLKPVELAAPARQMNCCSVASEELP